MYYIPLRVYVCIDKSLDYILGRARTNYKKKATNTKEIVT
jgi:hypothetical protein